MDSAATLPRACVLEAPRFGRRIRARADAGRLRRGCDADVCGGWGLGGSAALTSAFVAVPAAAPPRFMSTLPRKCAPSAIATRGEMMSPSTEPLSRMSTFSRAR